MVKPIDVRYIILNLLEMIMVFVKEMRQTKEEEEV